VCKRFPKRLNDKFISLPMALVMNYDHHLFPEFEEVVQMMSSSGLLQFYVKEFNWYRYLRTLILVDNSSQPKIFTLADLAFGFVLWLGACGVSMAVFILEKYYFFLAKAISMSGFCNKIIKATRRLKSIDVSNFGNSLKISLNNVFLNIQKIMNRKCSVQNICVSKTSNSSYTNTLRRKKCKKVRKVVKRCKLFWLQLKTRSKRRRRRRIVLTTPMSYSFER
jgi:hypothetical protein